MFSDQLDDERKFFAMEESPLFRFPQLICERNRDDDDFVGKKPDRSREIKNSPCRVRFWESRMETCRGTNV